MSIDYIKLSQVFRSIKSGQMSHEICQFCEQDLRPVLPCLLRMTVLPEMFMGTISEEERESLRQSLLSFDAVNPLVQLMSADFVSLKKELGSRQMIEAAESVQNENTFEHCDATGKQKMVLSRLLCLDLDISARKRNLQRFEPLENVVFFQEIVDLLCVALCELPFLVEITQIIHILVHFQNGAEIAVGLVANFPDQWTEVVEFLIEKSDFGNLESPLAKQTQLAIEMIISLQPEQVEEVILKLNSDKKMPGLMLSLTSEFCDDSTFVSLMTGFLVNHGQSNSISQYLVSSQKKLTGSPCIHKIKAKLEKIASRLVSSKDETNFLPLENISQAANLLRLISALKAFGAFKFSSEQADLFLSLVCLKGAVCAQTAQFLSIGLATILSCPALIHAQQIGQAEEEAAKLLIDWVRWMMDNESVFEQSLESDSRYGELLLLIAFQFHADQFSQISQLVSTVFGFKVTVQSKMLHRLKLIFTNDLMNEQTVAQRAASVAVTKGLSAKHQGYSAIHCILQLLRSRSFARFKISIKDWIVDQLINSETPVHSAIPELLEAYVRSCLLPLSKGSFSLQSHSSLANKPLDEDKLLEIFNGNPLDDSRLITRILVAYYLLFYDQLLESDGRKIAQNRRIAPSYTDKLWSAVPFRHLAVAIANKQKEYVAIHAPFMKLLATQYPYLLPTCLTNYTPITSLDNEPNIIGDHLSNALKHSENSPMEAVRFLRKMRNLPTRRKVDFMDCVLEGLPYLISHRVSNKLLEEVASYWTDLECVLPRLLYEKTVNALIVKTETYNKNVTHTDLCKDPLTVLRCDQGVFRCPPILELFLRMIAFYQTASRFYLKRQVMTSNMPFIKANQQQSAAQSMQMVEEERNRLIDALIGAQESAVVQILLEICLPNEQEKTDDKGHISVVRHVQRLVCSHIHQMFINEPALSKLVHFQGYPLELIPITVSGIPSMHICLDFIPELLSQPDMEKRAFAIELLSHLCQQYATIRAFTRARLTIDVLFTLLTGLPFDTVVPLMTGVCCALARIGTVFPPLMTEVCSLICQVGSMCASRIGVRNKMCLTAESYRNEWLDWKTLDSYSQTPEVELLLTLQKTFKENLLKSDKVDITVK